MGQIKELKLIYFTKCPAVPQVRSLLTELGIKHFREINQDLLEVNHPMKQYSSPTILYGNEIILGSQTSSSSCSVNYDFDDLRRKLLEIIHK